MTDRRQEHVVQWHPTILTKLVLIPQRLLNAYSTDLVHLVRDDIDDKTGKKPRVIKTSKAGTYQDGDFLIRFAGCEFDAKRNCEQEMKGWWVKWKNRVEELDGRKPM